MTKSRSRRSRIQSTNTTPHSFFVTHFSSTPTPTKTRQDRERTRENDVIFRLQNTGNRLTGSIVFIGLFRVEVGLQTLLKTQQRWDQGTLHPSIWRPQQRYSIVHRTTLTPQSRGFPDRQSTEVLGSRQTGKQTQPVVEMCGESPCPVQTILDMRHVPSWPESLSQDV